MDNEYIKEQTRLHSNELNMSQLNKLHQSFYTLPYEQLLTEYNKAVKKVLADYNAEYIADIPWGKGYSEVFKAWEAALMPYCLKVDVKINLPNISFGR